MNLWEIHPAFVHFPLAFLLASTVVDIAALRSRRANWARVAEGLLVAGIISAVPVAAGGVLAYFTVPPHSEDADDRILLHAFFAVAAVVSYTTVLFLRWKKRRELVTRGQLVASLLGAVLLTFAGALGGYIVYHDGVGVVVHQSDTPLDELLD